MTLGIILAFCGIISFLAFRNAFFGLKLMASMAWIVLFLYMKGNPPGAIVEGSGAHTAMLVVTIGFALMIVLAGLGRGIEQTKDKTGAFSVKSEGFHFKLPDFMKSQSSPEARKRRTEQSTEDYRERINRALHPPKKERRR